MSHTAGRMVLSSDKGTPFRKGKTMRFDGTKEYCVWVEKSELCVELCFTEGHPEVSSPEWIDAETAEAMLQKFLHGFSTGSVATGVDWVVNWRSSRRRS